MELPTSDDDAMGACDGMACRSAGDLSSLGRKPAALLHWQCAGKGDPKTGNVVLAIKFQIFSN